MGGFFFVNATVIACAALRADVEWPFAPKNDEEGMDEDAGNGDENGDKAAADGDGSGEDADERGG